MSRWLPGERRLVSCTGKLRYDSGAAAALAKKKMRRHGSGGKRRDRQDTDIYHCDYCGGWHLGRSTAWRGKRVAAPPKFNWRAFLNRY